jgi:hypothetical protein
MNYRKFFVLLFCVATISGAFSVSADTLPVITSFVASASGIGHGYGITFTWVSPTDNYSGANFYFTCSQGVTIWNAGGSGFSCDTNGTSGAAVTVAGAAFTVKNVSGFTKTVYVKIVPKDYTGVENTAGAMQTSFTVTPLLQPLADFTASATSISSEGSITLSWVGYDIPGVNLLFDCVAGIHITSLTPAITGDLPCNTIAYASGLVASGSATLKFVNDSAQKAPITARVLPAIATGVYDSGHSLTLTRDVLGKIEEAAATVLSFTASVARVVSGSGVTFSWNATNATHANLQLQCSEGVTVTGVDSPATTTLGILPCNKIIFSSAQKPAGSAELFFKNTSGVPEQVTAIFLAQRSDDTYDATRGQPIMLTVSPAVAVVVNTTATSSVTASTGVSAIATPKTATTGITRAFTFKTPLYLGARGTAVSELQKFLAQDAALYPEGQVTGYFGKLTELAVKRFQKRYGLSQEGDNGFGFVGPKTRAKLNTLEKF